ncbi:hypothetical protein Tco_0243445 [Tanacetum coccineum]
MASLDHRLNPLFSIKECMTCGALYTADFCCSKGGLEDKILVPKPPQNCATCGNPVDGLYCRSCAFVRKCLNEGWYTIHDENKILNTSKSSNHNTNISCGNGAHIGYNCPPKAPIISNPEQCNQTIAELPQTLPSVHPTCNSGDENSFTYDSKPNFVDDSPNIFNPPPQPPMYSCEFYRNDARYGHYCTPQWVQNYAKKKKIKANWEIKRLRIDIEDSHCYDDDEDYSIAFHTFYTKEPVDSLIMENEHLDTIPSVENIIPIPSEFKGISEDTCDVPVYEDPSTFDNLSDHCMILSDSNNDGISIDDDSYENIEYIEASPLNLEYDSLEEVNDVDQEEKEFDLEDIFQIQDVILREKLLNISRLVTNIESLKNNPTPDYVFKSPSSFPIPVVDSDSFFEESDTSLSHLDNSLPEFETFSDHTEETRSGSTTTHANNSLPEYDSFLFEVEPDQGGLISIVISDNSNNPLLELPEFESFHFDLDPSFPRPPPEPPDVEISLIIETDAPVINNFDELNEDECFDPGGDEIDIEDDGSFTFVIQTFLSFLTYLVDSLFLCPFRNEDTIYDPGIST